MRVDVEASLEEAMMALLRARGPDKTICPSEAARQVSPNDWRALMDTTRAVAARLASEGRIEVTQQGQPIDLSSARGPVRLRLPRE
jgi:hypothetical protein